MLKPSLDKRERWIRNPLDDDYCMDNERVARKIAQRADEWVEMTRFVATAECLMQFMRRSLGDTSNNEPCGKCSSCITTEFTFDEPDDLTKSKAVEYMKKADIDLVCRKQTPKGGFNVYKFGWNIPKHMQVDSVIALLLLLPYVTLTFDFLTLNIVVHGGSRAQPFHQV